MKKKKQELSEAQMVIGPGRLLVERPSGMNFALYKYMRAYQGKMLKDLFRGPADPEIARLMRPRVDSLHLQEQVLKAREAQAGWLKESLGGSNIFTQFFRWLRSFFYAGSQKTLLTA